MAEASSGDAKGSGFWTLLPTLDPATDDVKEYVSKVKFLASVSSSAQGNCMASSASHQAKAFDRSRARGYPPAFGPFDLTGTGRVENIRALRSRHLQNHSEGW